jgi:DNA-binding NarL/FixJ family response regulator
MRLASPAPRDSFARMGVAAHNPCVPRTVVAIADDHPVMREGLARLIADECDLTISGSAATGAELRTLVLQQPPRVLVMELMLRDADGPALIKDLAALAPEMKIVVFTSQPEDVYAARCVRAGAHAYVMKHEPVATLFRAIRDTATGGIAVSLRVSHRALTSITGRNGHEPGIAAQLTDRELQIFRLAGLALATRAIAEKLGVSVKTVETHRENIKNKLDLQSHAELVARAAQWLRENGGR